MSIFLSRYYRKMISLVDVLVRIVRTYLKLPADFLYARIPESARNGINHSPVFGQKTPFDIHLQWFAAEDEGRTEEPTEHKIRQAREEGKVAKSMDLVSNLVLLFAIVTLGALASYFLSQCKEMISYFLSRATEVDIATDRTVVTVFLNYFLKLSLPLLIITFIIAILANVVQVGFFFTTKTITPDFSKIVPHFGKFFQRAIFSLEAAFNLGKSIIKIVIIVAIVYVNFMADLKKIIGLVHLPFLMGFRLFSSLTFSIIVEVTIAMLAISIIDYFFQRRQHMESLKMTVQEIKEERKMHEGDPLIKSRLRQKMQEILSKNMLQAVPKADVVITNPTHYAIALKWDKITMSSPTVTAKGVDHMAQKIKEVAFDSSVPIIENKPLAQALYKEVDIGESIPEKFYEVVAIILAEVYKLNGREQAAV